MAFAHGRRLNPWNIREEVSTVVAECVVSLRRRQPVRRRSFLAHFCFHFDETVSCLGRAAWKWASSHAHAHRAPADFLFTLLSGLRKLRIRNMKTETAVESLFGSRVSSVCVASNSFFETEQLQNLLDHDECEAEERGGRSQSYDAHHIWRKSEDRHERHQDAMLTARYISEATCCREKA